VGAVPGPAPDGGLGYGLNGCEVGGVVEAVEVVGHVAPLIGAEGEPERVDPGGVALHVGLPAFAAGAEHIGPHEHAVWAEALAGCRQEVFWASLRWWIAKAGWRMSTGS